MIIIMIIKIWFMERNLNQFQNKYKTVEGGFRKIYMTSNLSLKITSNIASEKKASERHSGMVVVNVLGIT